MTETVLAGSLDNKVISFVWRLFKDKFDFSEDQVKSVYLSTDNGLLIFTVNYMKERNSKRFMSVKTKRFKLNPEEVELWEYGEYD